MTPMPEHVHVEIKAAEVKRFDTVWNEGNRDRRCAYELLGDLRACAELPEIVGAKAEIILSNHTMSSIVKSYNLTRHDNNFVLFAVHVSDQIIYDLEKYYLARLARSFDLRIHLVCSDPVERIYSPIALQLSPVLQPD